MAARKRPDPVRSKAHMDDMTEKAREAHSRIALEKARTFRERAEAYFDAQDEAGLAYSEAGLANTMGWTVQRMQRYYDANDGKDDELVEAQVRAFEQGRKVEDGQAVLSYVVRLAYQRIQEQIDTSPIYQEKGMVTRGIFLNKQKRLGGYQDRMEARQDVSVNVTFGEGVDPSDFK